MKNQEAVPTTPPASYDEFMERLKGKINLFFIEAEEGKKVKAAALRARKISMELRDDMKNFRELSIIHDKENLTKRKI